MTGSSTTTLGALGDGRVDLLGLLGLVLVGVVVDDLAVVAELGDLVLEERLVEGLVAGGLGLREQQGDDLAVAAAVGGVAAGLVVVGAAGGQGRGAEEQGSAAGGDAVDGARHEVSWGWPGLVGRRTGVNVL